MTETIRIGDVKLPLADFVISATGVLGIRKSGKTYLAKGIVEQLLSAPTPVPVVVFDAIGVWRTMKFAAPGGRGFPLVVAGGEAPDLPLTPEGAPAIIRAAIHENIPLVIDLYDAKLSKADWRRIVQTCFRTLLYENTGRRLVVLEEAAEYAPQRVLDGHVYAEVEKLARMGGNKQLGLMLINQRAQELNKAVLELCDNLVLMRQRGSHAIDALEKWLDRTAPDVAREVAASMPHLAPGDCWIWTEDSERPVRTHAGLLKSHHQDRRAVGGARMFRAAKVDVGPFVKRMRGELELLIEEARQNDPVALQQRIRELERKHPAAKVVKVKEPILVATDRKLIKQLVEALAVYVEAGKTVADRLERAQLLLGLADRLDRNRDSQLQGGEEVAVLGQSARIELPVGHHPIKARPMQVTSPMAGVNGRSVKTSGASDLSETHVRILGALAWWAAAGQTQPTRYQAAFLARYSVNGHFKNEIGAMRTAGLIDYPSPGRVSLTSLGATKAPSISGPGPSRSDMLNAVRAVLRTETHRRIFEAVIQHDGGSREQVAAAAGYSVNGHFKNEVGAMRSLGVIVYPSQGTVGLNPALFG